MSEATLTPNAKCVLQELLVHRHLRPDLSTIENLQASFDLSHNELMTTLGELRREALVDFDDTFVRISARGIEVAEYLASQPDSH
jgi:hypothetical protein